MRGFQWMSVIACCVFCGLTHAQVTCVVTTAQQLRDVLNCINSGDCSACPTCPGTCPNRIIISANAIIDVGTTTLPFIDLNSNHSGIELRINGTINWAGGIQNESYKLLQLSGTDNILITSTTGPARLTSPLFPCEQGTPNCPNPPTTSDVLPTAIRIYGDCDSVTISNLNIDHLGYAIQMDVDIEEEEHFRDTINLINLSATEMAHYGFYGYAKNLTVTNCRVGDPNNSSVRGTYNRHGMRFYGDNQVITDSHSLNVSNFALWPVSAINVRVDNVVDRGALVFGPNPSYDDSDPEETLRNIVIRNATVTFNTYGTLQGMRAELGTWRALVLDSTTVNQFTIGQQSSNGPTGAPHRALNRIHWKNLTGNYAIASNTFNCIGTDIFAIDCIGDITNTTGGGPDGVVGIDDLLAVISGWGTCSGPPALPVVLGDPCPANLSPCKADVAPLVVTGSAPTYGDNVVNIDDLLAVISAWGNCGGPPEDFPNGLSDCFNIYCTGLTGLAREECLTKCFEAYCIKYPGDC